ncbi:MAG TPA: deoxyhypusine synthase family protein [Nitrososphaerales archaeon]|nr:deoxyhypusine synthase family protein [Nitrososphaerales archaeon]
MAGIRKESDIDFKYFDSKASEIKLSSKTRALRNDLLSKPVRQLDLGALKSIRDLVSAWSRTSIQSRSISECAQVYENMLSDRARPTVMIGLSGALIAGGLRKVIRDLVEAGFIDVIVSTGAIVYQDFYQSQGFEHFMGTPNSDDALLHDVYIDRIYDTFVDEIGFVKTDDIVGEIARKLEPKKYSTRQFMAVLGDRASIDPNSIVGTSSKHGVPIFVPAIADSSLGIGLAGAYRAAKKSGRDMMQLDTIQDNYEIAQIVLKSRKTGSIYVSGGVPKNYINDAAVMLDYTPGHSYSFQITTDAPHWGGLTGSTLDEAKSWGKISKKATRATAYVEATIGLPLIAAYVLESPIKDGRKHLKFDWEGDVLKGISE